MERLARHESSGRDLFFIAAERSEDIPADLALPCAYFACLIAWDARRASDESVSALANNLFQSGCVYVCCWGPDCSRVHDLFDLAELELRPEGPWAMSTCHARESLGETLWFLLSCANPADAFFPACRAAIGIAIGSPEWSAEIRAALSSPDEFCERVLRLEGG
jgi:hypothetical protein